MGDIGEATAVALANGPRRGAQEATPPAVPFCISGEDAPACTSTGGHPLADGTSLPTDVEDPIPQGLGDPQARQAPS